MTDIIDFYEKKNDIEYRRRNENEESIWKKFPIPEKLIGEILVKKELSTSAIIGEPIECEFFIIKTKEDIAKYNKMVYGKLYDKTFWARLDKINELIYNYENSDKTIC